MGKAIGSVKYADEFVLLAKEETVLQGVIDRRIEIERCCGTKMHVERNEVMGIYRQISQDTLWWTKHDRRMWNISTVFVA